MLKQLLITIALVSFISAFTLAQEQPSTDKKECAKGCCSGHDSKTDMTMAHMDKDSTHSSHNKKKSNNIEEVSIIREGEIDLATIDKNEDSKVYQDQMCWNVISDEAGECPLCGMTLKEVTLKKAEENLLKNNFKVKE